VSDIHFVKYRAGYAVPQLERKTRMAIDQNTQKATKAQKFGIQNSADPERAQQRALESGSRCAEFVGGGRQQLPTGIGQAHTAWIALEQHQIQHRLQLLDLQAESRTVSPPRASGCLRAQRLRTPVRWYSPWLSPDYARGC